MYKSDLLEKYVALFNYGAENGDFEPMLSLFEDDAVYEFEDPRIGIFEGRERIARMFRLQSPTSNINVFNLKERSDVAEADYSDDLAPITRLGGIALYAKNGKIKKLVIKR
jgi:hypothetical protein